ncbi:MAG: sialidase family protein [Kiritimatiellaeota bacterium]|nr:sialidase family protein [Kiritimatiellota bacterium]
MQQLDKLVIISIIALSAMCYCGCIPALKTTKKWEAGKLKLSSKEIMESPSPFHGAFYCASEGLEMNGPRGKSYDNGKTWQPFTPGPDPMKGLPKDYRRGPYEDFVDPSNGWFLQLIWSLDVETNPKIDEPVEYLANTYLRYRVSTDKGKTYPLDKPVIMQGDFDEKHPFPKVYRGKNAYLLGDAGSRPIRTKKGYILVPAIAFLLGPEGKMISPGGGFTYGDAMIIIGKWRKDQDIEWFYVYHIEADPTKATRGMDEPTLMEMPDGRILCIMRGSNGGEKDPECKIPSYKWQSISEDGGFTWSKPEPWKYDTGENFFSPSAMSYLFKHSNGRFYWIGNISDKNCQGNAPRYPLYIGEVNPATFALVKSSLVMLDTIGPDDTEGLNLSHIRVFEDRETHNIVIPMSRHNLAYTKNKPVVYKISAE